MTCPHCQKEIEGVTGLQELHAFEKHLKKCRKNPVNIVLRYGKKVVVQPLREQDLREALEIRADSGQ